MMNLRVELQMEDSSFQMDKIRRNIRLVSIYLNIEPFRGEIRYVL